MTNGVSYTSIEIHSYLPSGWSLLETAESSSDGLWSATVTDGADVEWALEVKAATAAKLGRTEALRQAMNRLYREALG